MAEVPDRQDLVAVHRRDEGIEGGEVVPPAAVDERPGDPFAGDGDAEAGEEGVVLLDVLGVAGLVDEVAPALVLPDEGGALEAGQEEGGEDSRFMGHDFILPECDEAQTLKI